MKAHLTDRQLIDYEFKLARDASINQAATHLEMCKLCRERLEELKQKLASLDLLREDVKITEELISSAVAQADKPVQTRTVLFTRNKWIAATAAVITAGVLLLFTPSVLNRRQPTQDVVFDRAVTKTDVAAAVGEKTPALGMAQPSKQKSTEQPPFAPASAIELVTLPRRGNVQLTIYNSADLTLVRERRNITLKQGWNWLQFMWANTLIDPTSLSLEPLKDADKVEIQQLVFPPRLRELGRWLIRSEVTGQVPFEITYFTSGLSWRAFYMGTLSQDEKTMRLEGYVRVSNTSGEDYENAQTRLIVGQVHLLDQIAELSQRQYPYGSPLPVVRQRSRMSGLDGAPSDREELSFDYKARDISGAFDELRRKEIKKEGLSEYFLYTIEGTETIPDKWAKRLLSLETSDIPVKSLYKYDEERWGTQTITFVAFTNDKDHKLGETPIPNGNVKIYTLADEQGHLSYVGGAEIKYIPVGEEIELDLGPARLVRVEPLLMDFKTENHVFDKDNNVSGWDEVRTWRIEVINTRNLPVEFEITRGFDTAYWDLQLQDSGVSYNKHDATHARFMLNLEPQTKREFEYIVRTYHGSREESFIKLQQKSRSGL